MRRTDLRRADRLRTICPDLVQTVRRPILRASIACFRYRLLRIEREQAARQIPTELKSSTKTMVITSEISSSGSVKPRSRRVWFVVT